jgi:hypothetical protein
MHKKSHKIFLNFIQNVQIKSKNKQQTKKFISKTFKYLLKKSKILLISQTNTGIFF